MGKEVREISCLFVAPPHVFSPLCLRHHAILAFPKLSTPEYRGQHQFDSWVVWSWPLKTFNVQRMGKLLTAKCCGIRGIQTDTHRHIYPDERCTARFPWQKTLWLPIAPLLQPLLLLLRVTWQWQELLSYWTNKRQRQFAPCRPCKSKCGSKWSVIHC